MKKKLTLNEAWEKCMAMWDWLVQNPEKSKRDYINKFGGHAYLKNDCYFCEYAVQNDGFFDVYNKHRTEPMYELCSQCPGYLVSKTFCCEGYPSYDWDANSKGFFRKLKQLYKRFKEQQS